METTRDVVEQVKRLVNLRDVIQMFGFPLGGSSDKYRSRCFLHCGDNKTSFSADFEKNRWKCHSCGKGGDVISFVREAKGCDFKTAVEFLASVAGINQQYISEKDREKIDKLNRIRHLVPKLEAAIYETMMNAVEGNEGMWRLAFEGIDFDDTRLNRAGDWLGKVKLSLDRNFRKAYLTIQKEVNYSELLQALLDEKEMVVSTQQ